MTKPITLKLTFEELQQIDKYVELNDETRPLFDKIRNAYPEPKVTFENHGDFDVVSYQDPKNSNRGDETYWRVEQPNSFSWWRRYTIPQRLDMVQNKEKEQELEKLYQEQLEQEIIKRNLKTSLQELANGDVRPIYDVVRESKKWCEENPEKSVEEYLKPHTPEKTEKSLREAFKKVQQTEEWKETQRKIDAPKESWMNKPVEELVAILEKNPPDCLKFVMSKSLEQLIERWWCDIFSTNTDWDMETSIQDLCDRIFLWLPKEQDSSGTQRIETIVAVDTHNELLRKIKSKLHNNKDT